MRGVVVVVCLPGGVGGGTVTRALGHAHQRERVLEAGLGRRQRAGGRKEVRRRGVEGGKHPPPQPFEALRPGGAALI